MRLPLSVGGAFCRPFHRSLHSFDRISIVVTQYQWGAHAIASFARIDLRRRN